MKKEEFYFDSRDGQSEIHAVRYTPEEGVRVVGVLQIIHGMAEYIERYEHVAEFFTGHGYVVTGEDHLGHGGTIAKSCGIPGYFCEQDPATVVVRDVHRLKKMTQELYPDVPYVILGHSMGSFILRNYLCRYGSGIAGAVVLGTGMQSAGLIGFSKLMAGLQKRICGSRHVSRFIDRSAFGGYNKRIENPRTSYDWVCSDPKVIDAYMADDLCGFPFTVNGFQTLFELIARVQKAENLARIPKELPVLLASGEEDPVGGYGEGVRRAYESLRTAGLTNLTLKLYKGVRHELLNDVSKEEAMADILAWLSEHIAG